MESVKKEETRDKRRKKKEEQGGKGGQKKKYHGEKATACHKQPIRSVKGVVYRNYGVLDCIKPASCRYLPIH